MKNHAGREPAVKARPVDIARQANWPGRRPSDAWWRLQYDKVRRYPKGRQSVWGLPFLMPVRDAHCAIVVTRDRPAVRVPLRGTATYVCLLHNWHQKPEDVHWGNPTEGLVVAEYQLQYADGTRHVQPVRSRFEVRVGDSPGEAWLAKPFKMPKTLDPGGPVPAGMHWGALQYGLESRDFVGPLIYALPNPCPARGLRALVIRGLSGSPLIVSGITLFNGSAHPLAHLPRRTYRVRTRGQPPRVKRADVDLGMVARVARTRGPCDAEWLRSGYAGTQTQEPERDGEDLLEIVGAPDAAVSVTLERDGQRQRRTFSVGEAFRQGQSRSGPAALEVLGRRRQWMQVRVVDASTGRPTPVRIHFAGPRGEYLAPYGHHAQINTNWFEDYGADVVVGGRNYAYVSGEFTTELPVGDVYVEICKGFEYAPVRRRVTIRPGAKTLELTIARAVDLRRQGWITADTHVHFISPHTAWLEGRAEGINVVNLLATQWGRCFTNVGDITGRVGIVEHDTIVYVGTENRNHMLGHMSMLGTKGLPVFPMCCGGPSETWVGDPEFVTMAEWALENRRKGGLVIRPHFPYCGNTEDPVPILKGLVDALEIAAHSSDSYPTQEWYRYLNCGYRVAACGGTDKMGAYTALGWRRTYARIRPGRPFTYEEWARAVRAGRTVSTNGPMLTLAVDGREIGETIAMRATGGTVDVEAWAYCVWPLGVLEIVHNGRVVAARREPRGARELRLHERIRVDGSGWIAARCGGLEKHPGGYAAAHTSPVYVKCGHTRAFDGPAAEHMLALVEGGIEYLRTLATVFDEPARRRMVKLFKEAQAELKGRLVVEARHAHHHGDGLYHHHGHGGRADHRHA